MREINAIVLDQKCVIFSLPTFSSNSCEYRMSQGDLYDFSRMSRIMKAIGVIRVSNV
jgi:hypothetical protein